MNKLFMPEVNLPVAYFTQVMGIALGLPGRDLALQRLMTPLGPMMARQVAGGAHV